MNYYNLHTFIRKIIANEIIVNILDVIIFRL